MLKSIYISTFITMGLAGLVVSLINIYHEGFGSSWLGAAIACAGPIAFFARAYTLPIARTSANMPLILVAGVVGTGVAVFLAGSLMAPSVLVAAGVGILANVLYIFWYSRFAAPGKSVLATGAMLPSFELMEGDKHVSSAELAAKPALWIFYRGNWCPLCMAQIKEVAAQYRELAARGVEVILVSPQPQSHTASLAAKVDAPMRFMTDKDNAAAAALGVLEKNGLPAGMQVLGYDSDVPRPTVFITAAGGKLIYCDLSENYRVRPEPSEFLAVLDQKGATAAA